MSFPRAPLNRCNERTAPKPITKSLSRDKPKTATLGSSRTASKTSVKQRANSSAHHMHLLDRGRARLGTFASAFSLERSETWRNRSASQDKEGQKSTASSPSPRKSEMVGLDSSTSGMGGIGSGGGGGGSGGGPGLHTPTPSVSAVNRRQAQNTARRRVLETQFAVKSKRFSQLRKEIVDRQHTMADLHRALCDMHERLLGTGAKDLPAPEGMPLVEVELAAAVQAAAVAAQEIVQASREVKSDTKSEVKSEKSENKLDAEGETPPASTMARRRSNVRSRLGVKGGEGDEEGSDLTLLNDDLTEHLRGPTEEAMTQVETQLRAVPAWCLEACRDALNKRNEVLNWVSELDSSNQVLDDEGRNKLSNFKQEGEASAAELEAEQRAQMGAVESAVETVRALAVETEAARRDYEQAAEHARQQLQQLQEHQQHVSQVHAQAHSDMQRALMEAHTQLKEAQAERETHAASALVTKERVGQLEAQLSVAAQQLSATERRANAAADEALAEHERFRIVAEQLNLVDCYLKEERGRVRELEARLSGDEARIKKFNGQMTALEESLRSRDIQHESRLQTLHAEALQNAETARKLEAQKDALERRVQDLGALLAGQETEELNTLGQLRENREEMRKHLEKEKELRLTAQTELEREKLRIAELEEKAAQLTEALRAAGNAADERSAALAQELDSMKKQLRETLMKVASMEDERIIQEDSVRKLELRQHREREEKQALSAELEQREAALSAAQSQLRELRSKAEAQRDRVLQLERQLSLARTTRPLEQALQQQQQDFQKKVTELQNALKEVVRHNDELERAVVQKQQEVEQRERVMREQAKVLKVRDELIVLLKSKEQRQEEAVEVLRAQAKENEDANKKATSDLEAKVAELQQIYTALETKQLQVTKLEALVKQLEDQQERSQAQRTRQEARISSLEMLLQAQEQPQRYDLLPPLPPSPVPPPSPNAPRPRTQNPPPPSYYFWNGRELNQIERIPTGAEHNPPKGTFYLTVDPKIDRAASADPIEPPVFKFVVTANMGVGDVEEGLITAETGMQEALAQATDAAVALAAFAAVETGRQAMNVCHQNSTANDKQQTGPGPGVGLPWENRICHGPDAIQNRFSVGENGSDTARVSMEEANRSGVMINNSQQNIPLTLPSSSLCHISEGQYQPNIQYGLGSLPNICSIYGVSNFQTTPVSFKQNPPPGNNTESATNLHWNIERQNASNRFLMNTQLRSPLRNQSVWAGKPTLPGVRLRAGASEPWTTPLRPRPASAPAISRRAPLQANNLALNGNRSTYTFLPEEEKSRSVMYFGTVPQVTPRVRAIPDWNASGDSTEKIKVSKQESTSASGTNATDNAWALLPSNSKYINSIPIPRRSKPTQDQNVDQHVLAEGVQSPKNPADEIFHQTSTIPDSPFIQENATIGPIRMHGGEGGGGSGGAEEQKRGERGVGLVSTSSPRFSREHSPVTAWVPWASDDDSADNTHVASHGDSPVTDSDDLEFHGLGFQLFYPEAAMTEAQSSENQRPGWFAFMSQSPIGYYEDDRNLQSYVTLPVGEMSDDQLDSMPKDIRSSTRAPLRCAPVLKQEGFRSRGLEGGEGPLLQDNPPVFSLEVEVLSESVTLQRPPSCRVVPWTLPTIEEVSSESRDRSDATKHLTTSDDTSGYTRAYDTAAGSESIAGNESKEMLTACTKRSTLNSTRTSSPPLESDGMCSSDVSMDVGTSGCRSANRDANKRERTEKCTLSTSQGKSSVGSSSGESREDLTHEQFSVEQQSFKNKDSQFISSRYAAESGFPIPVSTLPTSLCDIVGEKTKQILFPTGYEVNKDTDGHTAIDFQQALKSWSGSQLAQNNITACKRTNDLTKEISHSKLLNTREEPKSENRLETIQKGCNYSKLPLAFCIRAQTRGTVHRLFSGTEIHQTKQNNSFHLPELGREKYIDSPAQMDILNPVPLSYCQSQADKVLSRTSSNHSGEISLPQKSTSCHSSNSRTQTQELSKCKHNDLKLNFKDKDLNDDSKTTITHKQDTLTSEHSSNEAKQRCRVDKEIFKQRIRHSRAVTRSIANVYAILHAETTESMEDSDTPSENSCHLNPRDYDTEDSYETDLPSIYQHPIHISMQCMETFECHTEQCQSLHW